MTESTPTSPLATTLAELGWKPEVLARRLNDVAALHGRCERVHAKTPYKWLRAIGRARRGLRWWPRC